MPRSIRFRYNPVFLPEYLSTIALSVPISALFMTSHLGGGRVAMGANPHLSIAIVLYGLVALWLLGLTMFYRWRFRSVIFWNTGLDQLVIDAGTIQIPLADVNEARESLGRFFGRTVRMVIVEDQRGGRVCLCDALFHFDHLRGLLSDLLRQEISHVPDHEPERRGRVQSLWKERHQTFPAPETLGDVLNRLGWRGVCLLPVAVVEVLIHLGTIFSLSKLQQHLLMVYATPLSLVVSGLIARYVYYYMFSSTAMNRPLGAKTR